MRTIKLVIIGDSGVGKTSLRSSYVSGRFSAGYRATIGTDFITKALSHHSNPEEVITLQIWDTAGQERFSSLSTAFFRGADAVLMMYDVNKPQTLQGLKKWWKEFQERAPVLDEETADYCCVVVGNKIDLAEETAHGRNMAVSEEQAKNFLEELIPSSSGSQVDCPPNLQTFSTLPTPGDTFSSPSSGESSPSSRPTENGAGHPGDDHDLDSPSNPKPIDIRFSGDGKSVSRATSRSRLAGTMTTTHTNVSIYYTPSSSFFDEYVSAPSSPIHSATSSNHTPRSTTSFSSGVSRRRATTTSTTSSSDTITPSLFARHSPAPPAAPFLDRGPRLFLTSAKSGQSVRLVFEYIAKRVVSRWEWEESVQGKTFAPTDRQSDTRTVVLPQVSQKDTRKGKTCCS